MDAERARLAETCLRASHDGSMSFPEIVGALIAAGFEGYAVDWRASMQTYYQPDGGSLALAMPHQEGTVTAPFDTAAMAGLVRWAQAGGPDYSYAAFARKAKAAGCAGYLVSFPGRRVVYYGRDATMHVEHFPN